MKQLPVTFMSGKHMLRGVVYVPAKYTKAIIFAHGYPGDSSGGTDRRARFFARNGVLAFRFDMRGCGASCGQHEERLLSTDIADLEAAIAFLKAHAEFDTLVLHGHSTGALIAPFAAKHVSAVILSAGAAHLDAAVHYDFTPKQVRELWTRGYTHTLFPLEWLGKKGKICKEYYDEFFTLNLSSRLRTLRKPTLVVHGTLDEAIPVKCAHEVYALLPGPKRLAIITGADHRFKKKSVLAGQFLRCCRLGNRERK